MGPSISSLSPPGAWSGQLHHPSDNRANHHRHDDGHHHSQQPNRDQQHDAKKKVDLVDLDAPITGRKTIRVSTAVKIRARGLTKFLQQQFSGGVGAIPNRANLDIFYLEPQAQEIPTIWYRVLNLEDPGLSFGFEWFDTCHEGFLSGTHLHELKVSIFEGATVGELRARVAAIISRYVASNSYHDAFIEPAQVVIEAIGGLRPGPIEGDQWVCNNIKLWLCHYLRIRLVKQKHYILFYGFNQRYVLHGPSFNFKHEMHAHQAKKWLREMLTTVGRGCNGIQVDGIDGDDIQLFFNSIRVNNGTRIFPGQAIDFQLNPVAGSKYTEAEVWLVPPTEVCHVCFGRKAVSEMPDNFMVTRGCQHRATVCKECVGDAIRYGIENLVWNRLTCPECPQLLSFDDIKAYAAEETFARYDKLSTRKAAEQLAGFQWCLNPKCDSGAVYDIRHCGMIMCGDCGEKFCSQHQMPWHTDETCKEYDRRMEKREKGEERSKKCVEKITKPCPSCWVRITKDVGCDHITCICGHEWCWECFGDYIVGGHKVYCSHYGTEPFDDAFDAIA